ncbi:MAG: hypothetical protein HYZ71_14930 [Deltaproteobacteria bacterium]|nr:hypothetical protein [Deltaproteobacteria bacterium]
MKQGIRLFVKPGTFFNQLQWSSHHWLILIGFFIASAVETQLGSANSLFMWYANFLTIPFGVGLGAALWIITFARLAFLLSAAWVATVAIWLFGTLLGHRSSRRVLFRRLAVVFTILLSGYTAQHLSNQYEFASLLALGLYVWGSSLGYFAIAEQFRLNKLQTLAVALFAMIVVSQGWKLSSQVLRVEAVALHSDFTSKSTQR